MNEKIAGTEIIFVGSSYTKCGFNDEEIRESLNMKSMTWGRMSATPNAIKTTFYTALQRFPDAKIIAVEVNTSYQISDKSRPRQAKLGETDLERLDEIEQAGRAKGVEVIFFYPPSTRSVLSTSGRDILNFDDSSAYPELFEPELRIDATHLNAKGAILFSRVFCDAIKARSESARVQ